MMNRRELILKTSLKLFTEKGYFNTSVHDIQREANVSIGSIYHYFKNKEAIAKALFDDLVAGMTKRFEDILDAHESSHDRCRAVISCLFNQTEESPEAMQYMLYAKHREFLPNEKPVCSSRPFEMMKQMVEQGIEKGEIKDVEPIVAATSLFGGPIRLIYLRLDGVLEKALPCYLDETWQCAWDAVVL